MNMRRKITRTLRHWRNYRQQPKWNRHPLYRTERGVDVYPAALADPTVYREWRERQAMP